MPPLPPIPGPVAGRRPLSNEDFEEELDIPEFLKRADPPQGTASSRHECPRPAAPPSVRPRRVVTDRRGGRSRSPYDSFNLGDHVGDDPADVAANRARLARELGVAEDRLVWMNQVHGTGVAVVDGPQDGPVAATDALVTATPGLVLCVLVADCVPVLLADPGAGWSPPCTPAGRACAGASSPPRCRPWPAWAPARGT